MARLFATDLLYVAQKVVVRLERQVATVYPYFCAAVALPLCYCNASFLATVAYASPCYSRLLAQYQRG